MEGVEEKRRRMKRGRGRGGGHTTYLHGVGAQGPHCHQMCGAQEGGTVHLQYALPD